MKNGDIAIMDLSLVSFILVFFMANRVADEAKWAKWKGRMPVIYNEPSLLEPLASNLNSKRSP